MTLTPKPVRKIRPKKPKKPGEHDPEMDPSLIHKGNDFVDSGGGQRNASTRAFERSSEYNHEFRYAPGDATGVGASLRADAGEDRVRKTSKTPKGWPKDPAVFISRNAYVLRSLEKEMEKSGVAELATADLRKPEYQKFGNNPVIKTLFEKGNGQVTLESLQAYQKELGSTGEKYYRHHSKYPGAAEYQIEERFNKLPAQVYALVWDDLGQFGVSDDAKKFIEDLSPQMKHRTGERGEHVVGLNGRNLGYIIWKDITSVLGEPAVLIQQMQSDWKAAFSEIAKLEAGETLEIDNIKITQEHLPLFYERVGGKDFFDSAKADVLKLIKDYPQKLLQAFLVDARGKKVFMHTAKAINKAIGKDENTEGGVAEIVYRQAPKAFGFQPSMDPKMPAEYYQEIQASLEDEEVKPLESAEWPFKTTLGNLLWPYKSLSAKVITSDTPEFIGKVVILKHPEATPDGWIDAVFETSFDYDDLEDGLPTTTDGDYLFKIDELEPVDPELKEEFKNRLSGEIQASLEDEELKPLESAAWPFKNKYGVNVWPYKSLRAKVVSLDVGSEDSDDPPEFLGKVVVIPKNEAEALFRSKADDTLECDFEEGYIDYTDEDDGLESSTDNWLFSPQQLEPLDSDELLPEFKSKLEGEIQRNFDEDMGVPPSDQNLYPLETDSNFTQDPRTWRMLKKDKDKKLVREGEEDPPPVAIVEMGEYMLPLQSHKYTGQVFFAKPLKLENQSPDYHWGTPRYIGGVRSNPRYALDLYHGDEEQPQFTVDLYLTKQPGGYQLDRTRSKPRYFVEGDQPVDPVKDKSLIQDITTNLWSPEGQKALKKTLDMASGVGATPVAPGAKQPGGGTKKVLSPEEQQLEKRIQDAKLKEKETRAKDAEHKAAIKQEEHEVNKYKREGNLTKKKQKVGTSTGKKPDVEVPAKPAQAPEKKQGSPVQPQDKKVLYDSKGQPIKDVEVEKPGATQQAPPEQTPPKGGEKVEQKAPAGENKAKGFNVFKDPALASAEDMTEVEKLFTTIPESGWKDDTAHIPAESLDEGAKRELQRHPTGDAVYFQWVYVTPKNQDDKGGAFKTPLSVVRKDSWKAIQDKIQQAREGAKPGANQ